MIIGVTGTNGAGKGEVVQYVVEQKGFTHYSVSGEIAEELKRRGVPYTRPNLNDVGTEMREKGGPDYFTNLFADRAERAGIQNIVIESIRNPIEAESVKKHGGTLWVIDADKKLRYDRITLRGSGKDKVSFEEFVKHEDREMTSEDPSNPAKMNNSKVFSMADYTLHNNGTLEELHQQVDAVLAKIKG